MTRSDILLRAAALLARKDGWCQGMSHKNASGILCQPSQAKSHCAIGALSSLSPEDGSYYVVYFALQRQLGIKGLVGWNDTPGRTQAEVIEALVKTAIQLRSEGK